MSYFLSFQKQKDQRYCFSVIVNELEDTTAVDYQITILRFINCLINSKNTRSERIKTRNEFIGEFFLLIFYQFAQ